MTDLQHDNLNEIRHNIDGNQSCFYLVTPSPAKSHAGVGGWILAAFYLLLRLLRLPLIVTTRTQNRLVGSKSRTKNFASGGAAQLRRSCATLGGTSRLSGYNQPSAAGSSNVQWSRGYDSRQHQGPIICISAGGRAFPPPHIT